MKITKIEPQKKNKKRYNLYSEDIFLFGISEDTYVHFNIYSGKDYSDDQIKDIYNFEQVNRCLNQAYRFLSRRAHLETELARKLKQKGYGENIISEAINKLYALKYLDDRQFIHQFIKDAVKLKKIGPFLIKKKLLEKGAGTGLINEYIEILYPEHKQLTNAATLLSKKAATLNTGDAFTFRHKLSAYIKSKGFPWEIVEQVLPDIIDKWIAGEA